MPRPERPSHGLDFFFFIFCSPLTKRLGYLIFINAIVNKNADCIIPEASQEGPLRSFKSYDDVVLFHYSLPRQVIRATWQFAAFMENEYCPRRNVNLYLKWGSYPMLSLNNASYPLNVRTDDDATIKTSTVTSYEPKTMIYVPVYGPEPGDWFVAGYMDRWDEKIHQKGLGQECRYSLGSVAVWSETNGIENIPLGYEKNVITSQTVTYYKFYIPMDTWSFQVNVWGCNVTIKQATNFRDACIKNLDIKGRSLPNHLTTLANKSLTVMDSYTFTESAPYQDEWYYIMVVSSSTIKFNVKIDVTNCPIKTIEEVYVSRYISVPNYSRASDQLYLNNLKDRTLKSYANERAINRSRTNNDIDRTNGIDDYSNPCVTRYSLVRIKHAQTFTGNYLLRGRETFTSWLTLIDANPLVVQFNILPLVDVGGTLDINLELDVDEILIKQQVNVTVCISRGRLPKLEDGHIICDNKSLALKILSIDKNLTDILIPYPQPDVYYIAFKPNCYVDGLKAPCKVAEILIALNVKLRACAFKGNHACGKYGTCEEIHKGLMYLSSCKCFGGRQGWACTDDTNAVSEYTAVFTIMSNLFFVSAIYLALKRELYTEALVYISTMFFSAFYHACDEQSIAYCIAKFEVLQYCDFFLGMLAFWITLVSMADMPAQQTSFCHMLGVIIITFGVGSDKTGLGSSLIPLIVGCFIPLTSYGFYCVRMKKFVRPKRGKNLIIGLTLVTIGIIIFSIVETESNYRYVHSAWHAIIALSLIFLLPLKKEQVQSYKSDNKSLQCEESPSDFVFSISGRQKDNHLIEDIS